MSGLVFSRLSSAARPSMTRQAGRLMRLRQSLAIAWKLLPPPPSAPPPAPGFLRLKSSRGEEGRAEGSPGIPARGPERGSRRGDKGGKGVKMTGECTAYLEGSPSLSPSLPSPLFPPRFITLYLSAVIPLSSAATHTVHYQSKGERKAPQSLSPASTCPLTWEGERREERHQPPLGGRGGGG